MMEPGYVVLTLQFRAEQGRWTGECLELGTATYARTLQKTHDELVELVALHLDSLEAVGEREHFFQVHNITFYPDDAPPSVVRPSVPVDSEVYVHAHRVRIGTAA
jgi:hypothetical protein